MKVKQEIVKFTCDATGKTVTSTTDELPEGWFYIKDLNFVVDGDRVIDIRDKHFCHRKYFSATIRSHVEGKPVDFAEIERPKPQLLPEKENEMTFSYPKQEEDFNYPRQMPKEDLYDMIKKKMLEEEQANKSKKKKPFWKKK